jgi:NADPH-dependent 2,4-dienoyl-CoA reductase/sulfur reductase-like enzyme
VIRVDAEVAVVGAGPAGVCAAVEAARGGASVVLIDENPAPGGQIYRPPPPQFTPPSETALGREARRGRDLLRQLDALPVRRFLGATVWGAFGPNVLEATGPSGAFQVQARAVVVAAGAHDRPTPLPGWTLPGVLTVGGAQTLLKNQRVLPGRRILFVGTGPLLLVVAAQYADAGADIVAVADAVPTSSVLAHAGALLRCPGLLADGLRYRWSVRRRRIPWLAPRVLVRVEGASEVEGAVLADADPDWNPRPGTERSFDVDTVCVGYGLVPSVELLRLLGCAMRYDDGAAAWVPDRDADGRTSVPGVFAVGDGAGVAGAAVAADEGRVAGLAAAVDVGRLPRSEALDRQRPLRRRLARLARFRAAMDEVYRARAGLFQRATADTIVCRCEEVPLSEIESALADGAVTVGQVKAWTRTGMGPCQGRMCFLPTAHIVAARTGRTVAALGPCSVRPPVKPVAIAALIVDGD